MSPQLDRIRQKLQNFQQNFQQQISNLNLDKLSLKDAIAGNGISAPFVKGMKDAMAYQKVMIDIRKVVDFDTPEQFKQMGQDIRNMSLSLPMATEDISAIVMTSAQAGIAKEELKQFTDHAIKMGIAFDISAEDAVNTMTTWRKSLKLTQNEIIDLSDKINLLSRTQNIKAKDISDIVTKISLQDEFSGNSTGELAALSATMIASGTNADQTTIGIKNLISTLTSGAGATTKQQEAFQQLGMTSAELANRMQKDVAGTITSVLELLDKIPKEQQSKLLGDLFGEENIAGISPLLDNIEQLKINFNQVGDASQYAGLMQKEYESKSATTADELQRFNNSLDHISITIGETLLPIFTELLQTLTPLIVSFGEFIQQHPELVKMVAAVVAGLIGLGAVCNGVNTIIGTVITSINFFQAALRTSMFIVNGFIFVKLKLLAALDTVRRAFIVLNAIIMSNPMVFILTAIGVAIAAAVTLIIVYWDEITAFFRNLCSIVEPYFMPIYNCIVSLVDALRASSNWIANKIESISDYFSGLFDKNDKKVKVMVDTSSLPKELPRSMVTLPDYQAPRMPLNQFSNNNATQNRNGELVVKFANAPQGTIVKQTKQVSGINTRADVGWNIYAVGG